MFPTNRYTMHRHPVFSSSLVNILKSSYYFCPISQVDMPSNLKGSNSKRSPKITWDQANKNTLLFQGLHS